MTNTTLFIGIAVMTFLVVLSVVVWRFWDTRNDTRPIPAPGPVPKDMATLTLYSDGYGLMDKVFSVTLQREEIPYFINLVCHGGSRSGLKRPAIIIKTHNGEFPVNERNQWQIDVTEIFK